ncbi:MAG: pyridoxamine 5'-phosphate oxidase family protein [Thaumarchaeota archaeon]|nr:pyridoxamine 5'-phosphate oxidase family protein [Nitrososphaerota archaeon]
MRIYEADKGLAMTASQAKTFLEESKSNLLLGTVDKDGDPNIHAVWYYFDAKQARFYFITAKGSRKAKSLRRRASVYFSVDDDDRSELRGVRGKGRARIITDKKTAMSMALNVLLRYLKPRNSLTLEYAEEVRRGNSLVVEITPAYFTTWDSRNQTAETIAKQKAAAI